jgi:hypothetical protein
MMAPTQENRLQKGFIPSRLSTMFAPKNSSVQAWIEVAIFTLGALGICSYFEPSNPLLIGAPFPWLWLAPTVLALRYGSLAALGSSTIILAVWAFLMQIHPVPNSFPGQYFLGGLTLTLIAGEFCDVWTGRFKRIRNVNSYLSERLDSLTHRHYLLKVSSELLEQDLLVKPITLRDTLTQLRQLIVNSDLPENTTLHEASELMRILTQSCQLESASLHAEVSNQISVTPTASVGIVSSLDLEDSMVKYALAHNELCHVQTDALDASDSRYLVVAPLIATDGRRLGILTIERMPFISLNFETLQFLSVTLSYYADIVKIPPRVRAITTQYKDCPLLFAAELIRVDRIYRECGINSTLVALVFESSIQQQNRLNETIRQRRQLDVIWSVQNSEKLILITLMPLYNQNAAAGYLKRLESYYHSHFGTASFADAGVVPYTAIVGTASPINLLNELIANCHGN